MMCPHANHVLQQCVTTMRAASCPFIIQEILQRGTGAVCKAARHAYGCRVLQRLLEHWPGHVAGLADDLISEGLLLCRHTFGNYVMQHLLEYGSDQQRVELIQGMQKQALALGSDVRAAAPLSKAVLCASDTDRTA